MISHGSRSGFAQRHAVEVHVDAGIAARHLGQRRGEPGRAAVLQAEHEAALDEIERHLDQRLAAERVADLHRRALLVGALEVLAREHGRAADPVAAGQRAVEHEQVSRCRSPSRCSTRSVGSRPTHIAFTSGFAAYASSKTVSPPTFGMPVQLP